MEDLSAIESRIYQTHEQGQSVVILLRYCSIYVKFLRQEFSQSINLSAWVLSLEARFRQQQGGQDFVRQQTCADFVAPAPKKSTVSFIALDLP